MCLLCGSLFFIYTCIRLHRVDYENHISKEENAWKIKEKNHHMNCLANAVLFLSFLCKQQNLFTAKVAAAV